MHCDTTTGRSAAFPAKPPIRLARPTAGRSTGVVGRCEVPIDKVLEERGDVGGPSVLVVEVVGVFPNVDREQWCVPARERVVGVVGVDDGQLPPAFQSEQK